MAFDWIHAGQSTLFEGTGTKQQALRPSKNHPMHSFKPNLNWVCVYSTCPDSDEKNMRPAINILNQLQRADINLNKQNTRKLIRRALSTREEHVGPPLFSIASCLNGQVNSKLHNKPKRKGSVELHKALSITDLDCGTRTQNRAFEGQKGSRTRQGERERGLGDWNASARRAEKSGEARRCSGVIRRLPSTSEQTATPRDCSFVDQQHHCRGF